MLFLPVSLLLMVANGELASEMLQILEKYPADTKQITEYGSDNEVLLLITIPEFYFLPFSGLETLHLTYMGISYIARTAFEGLGQLRNLSLEGNYLTEIPTLKDLLNLVFLDLSNNIIENSFRPTEAISAFAQCKHLHTIILTDNYISEFPDLKQTTGSLHFLLLAYNLISKITYDRTAGTENLLYLDVERNKLTEVSTFF